jgi:hypothetical protein
MKAKSAMLGRESRSDVRQWQCLGPAVEPRPITARCSRPKLAAGMQENI